MKKKDSREAFWVGMSQEQGTNAQLVTCQLSDCACCLLSNRANMKHVLWHNFVYFGTFQQKESELYDVSGCLSDDRLSVRAHGQEWTRTVLKWKKRLIQNANVLQTKHCAYFKYSSAFTRMSNRQKSESKWRGLQLS